MKHDNDTVITLKDVLKKREININYALDLEELNELIQEFNLKQIDFVEAHFKILPIANQKGISVEGTLKAFVIHSCVVTLGPVPQSINEKISIRYTPDGEDDILGTVLNSELSNINLHQNYDVEQLIDGQVNVYDIIREYLSLSLLINPRVANARFDGFTVGNLDSDEKKRLNRNLERIADGEQPLSHNPFASLASLKQKIEKCP
jgi:uncharacterized metal-binding protein YceD (DUF177 family)